MKKIILIIALVVPGLIFVFLKYAGRNEFTIPVYYEDGIPALEGCDAPALKPYHIPEQWGASWRSMANVIVFNLPATEFGVLNSGLAEEFPEGLWLQEAREFTGDSIEYQLWKKCVFRVNEPWQTVLFDKEGKIRGYYDARSREEVDRLRVEIKILLKRF